MTHWILIVSWAVAAGQSSSMPLRDTYRERAIAMQEFDNLRLCQFASIKAQEIAPGIRVVCVQKGEEK